MFKKSLSGDIEPFSTLLYLHGLRMTFLSNFRLEISISFCSGIYILVFAFLLAFCT